MDFRRVVIAQSARDEDRGLDPRFLSKDHWSEERAHAQAVIAEPRHVHVLAGFQVIDGPKEVLRPLDLRVAHLTES